MLSRTAHLLSVSDSGSWAWFLGSMGKGHVATCSQAFILQLFGPQACLQSQQPVWFNVTRFEPLASCLSVHQVWSWSSFANWVRVWAWRHRTPADYRTAWWWWGIAHGWWSWCCLSKNLLNLKFLCCIGCHVLPTLAMGYNRLRKLLGNC